ncbi:MAG TPA: hypothetical protein VFW09_19285 [Solirubrobacteraceae bacterium]|nr:hypothetical protein [Solirubrobacteraceae bacterium]
MTSDYTLAYGTHPNPDDGRCAMEWVAHIAGEPHSDQPACVSPVVRALCVALNDGLDCSSRQRLRPYLTRTIGTSRDGLDERRAWMALDWLIRVYAPTWLRRAGLRDAAARLAGCAATTGAGSLTAAIEELGRARAAARGARQDEFGDVVHWALAVAGGETGSESAWSFTAAGAWGAARLAIGDRRAERARADVKALAADCAAIVARRARREPAVRRTLLGGRPSAAALLRPVTVELADSAIELLDRMLPTVTLDGSLGDALASAAAPAPA